MGTNSSIWTVFGLGNTRGRIWRRSFGAKVSSRGVTLIEVIVAIAIISMLAIAVLTNFSTQAAKARDATRKDDLSKMAKFLEEYFNDHQEYPSVLTMGGSGSFVQVCRNTISGYSFAFSCDPINKGVYKYTYESTGQAFAIHTNLENTKDAAIALVGCEAGCDPGNGGPFNFGIASSNSGL